MLPHPEDVLRLHRDDTVRRQRDYEQAQAATVRRRSHDDDAAREPGQDDR